MVLKKAAPVRLTLDMAERPPSVSLLGSSPNRSILSFSMFSSLRTASAILPLLDYMPVRALICYVSLS
jgi:hypothetical protein